MVLPRFHVIASVFHPLVLSSVEQLRSAIRWIVSYTSFVLQERLSAIKEGGDEE